MAAAQWSPESENQPPTSTLNQYTGTRIQPAPSSPVRLREPSFEVLQPFTAEVENGRDVIKREGSQVSRKPVGSGARPSVGGMQSSTKAVETDTSSSQDWPLPRHSASVLGRDAHARTVSAPISNSSVPPRVFTSHHDDPSETGSVEIDPGAPEEEVEQLQYHHTFESRKRKPIPKMDGQRISSAPDSPSASSGGRNSDGSPIGVRPISAVRDAQLSSRISSMTLGSDLHRRGRSMTPQDIRTEASLSPARYSRSPSSTGRSPDARASTIDLLNIPYAQQMVHQTHALDHALLKGAVGNNASLLDTHKTLGMYRANVKKTNDPSIQYEFAVFMVQAAQEASLPEPPSSKVSNSPDRAAAERIKLLSEARQILQKLADRSYPYAQYYLADGFFSGLFNKDKPDMDRAFPLFVSAGKHGHAESAYRAALCYEFGWGCRKDYAKAVQFHRQAAAKNHPGAATRLGLACITGDMGLAGKQREGVKWLKRATESADVQHNSAPYELAMLHINGFGDDVFKDETYAAQLLTKAADLGHPEANLRMGEAYEHGLLTCPKDPALSIHFYNGAAQAGIPKAMMALCAWYMVGAEPVLQKDEAEAYEWARKSAEGGYAKAAYAVGYFTEMGIGCRRDPLEANVWYVRAADEGDERAKQRLAIIREAEMAQIPGGNDTGPKGKGSKPATDKKKWWGSSNNSGGK